MPMGANILAALEALVLCVFLHLTLPIDAVVGAREGTCRRDDVHVSILRPVSGEVVEDASPVRVTDIPTGNLPQTVLCAGAMSADLC